MLTDVQLAGRMNGVELAHVAKDRNPKLDAVVTSGRPLMQPCLTAQSSGPSRGRRSTSCARPRSRQLDCRRGCTVS